MALLLLTRASLPATMPCDGDARPAPVIASQEQKGVVKRIRSELLR